MYNTVPGPTQVITAHAQIDVWQYADRETGNLKPRHEHLPRTRLSGLDVRDRVTLQLGDADNVSPGLMRELAELVRHVGNVEIAGSGLAVNLLTVALRNARGAL